MRWRWTLIFDVVALAGVTCLTAGCYLMWAPLGWLAAGAFLLAIGWLGAAYVSDGGR